MRSLPGVRDLWRGALALLLAGAGFVEVVLEDLFCPDVFGFVVAFFDAEVVLPGELVGAVVGVFVVFGFEVADAIA